MPSYEGPDSLAAEIAELKRRLHALETAPQSNRVDLTNGKFVIRSSVDPNVLISMDVDDEANDAGFRVYTSDGEERVYLGTATAGTHILAFLRKASLVVRSADEIKSVLDARHDLGLVRPVIPVEWQPSYSTLKDTVGHPYADSGTYTALWTGWVNCSTHLYYQFGVNLQGLVTSAQFKITVQDWFAIYGGAGEQTIHEETVNVDTSIGRNDPIPTAVVGSGELAGALLLLKVYARIAAGSGNPGVSVHPHMPAIPTQG